MNYVTVMHMEPKFCDSTICVKFKFSARVTDHTNKLAPSIHSSYNIPGISFCVLHHIDAEATMVSLLCDQWCKASRKVVPPRMW